MSDRVNGANRVILTLVGLVLLAAGVLGLIVSLGGFGSAQAQGPVVPQQLSNFAADNWWFWWVVAAACLVVALLALRWLVAQLRTDRIGRLDLTADARDGVTTVHAGAVTSAVEDEAITIRGVAAASARMRGEPARRLHLAVELTDYADIAEVRDQLAATVVPDVRQALDDPTLPVDIELRPERTSTAGRGLT